MAQPIGDLVEQALATGSSTPSANTAIVARPAEIVRPTNEEEARALQAWGSCTARNEPKATHEQIGRHLEFIAATLPTKKVDSATGKSRFAVYVSTLNGMSEQALAYMSRRVCQELDWFPTPHQCLTILNDFHGDKLTRKLACRYASDYWQERMETWLARLRDEPENVTPDEIAAVPERWRAVAECQCLLRRLGDGSYELRARMSGPHAHERDFTKGADHVD